MSIRPLLSFLSRIALLLALLPVALAASTPARDPAERAWKPFTPRSVTAKELLDASKAEADAPREFALGWTVAGTLSADGDGVASDSWTLVATPGAGASVALTADGSLDLAVADPDSRAVLGRAYAGSGVDSVAFTMPAGGRARVVVLDLAATGAERSYRLSAAGGSDTPVGSPVEDPVDPDTANEALAILGSAPPLAPGATRRGELRVGDATLPSDGSLVDGFLVDAAPGTRLEATLVSTDFDAYLLIVDGEGDIVARNDDADGTNARLDFTVPATGPLYIVANSYLVEGRGAYTLYLNSLGAGRPVDEDPRFAAGATLVSGDRIEGRLDSGDARHPEDGAPMDVYALDLRDGEAVTIEARSSDFDTYLTLLSADGRQQLASDDDGGSGTDSRLSWTARGPGTVRVVVRPYDASERGSYRLQVSGSAPDAGGDPGAGAPASGVAGFAAVARPLPQDGRVSGTLDGSDARLPDDGSLLEVWAFTATGAERVEVLMESDAFDTYLHLAAPELGLVLSRDDDSAGGTNSRIEFTVPGPGEYLVVANGYDTSSAGPYRLTVRRFPAEASSGDPRRALLVGINDYRGMDNDLTAPVLDALELRTVLIEDYGYPPENIELLTDGDATRGRILESVSRHLGSAPVDGSALFFYSGHGVQLDDVRSADASERDLVDEALYLADDSTLLDDELAALTRALPADRVAVILDSCYSGGGFRAVTGRPKGISENDLDAALPRPEKRADVKASAMRANRMGAGGAAGVGRARSILEIAASREDQLSWQYSRWPDRSEPLSVFTYYLLEALRDGARGGEPFSSAFGDLRTQTTALTQRAFGRPQDPIMSASEPGTELLDVIRP